MRGKANMLMTKMPLPQCVTVLALAARDIKTAAQIIAIAAVALVHLPARSAAEDGPRPYRLSTGDRISIAVAGQADLSGEFAVDAAGNVVLPMVGAVRVGELTMEESRDEIAHRLKEGYLRNPNVSVKAFELRPIYIFGEVKTAGGYPFRHGAMVLSAVALAGGFGLQDLAPGAGADYIAAVENVRALTEGRRILLVRRARLEAQLTGRSEFAADGIDGARDVGRDIIANETQQFAAQKAAREEEERVLKAQKPRIDTEMVFIREQMAGENRQLELLAKQIDQYGKVEGKGFGRSPIMLALQREQARLEGNLSKFQSDLARLELLKGEVDIKLSDAQQLYSRRLLLELQEVRTKLRETDATLPAALDLRDVRQVGTGGFGSLDATARRTYRFFVSRKRGAELTRTEVKDGSLLEPGDILEVVRAPRRDGMAQLPEPQPGR